MLAVGKRDLDRYVAKLELPTCAVDYEDLHAQPEAALDRVQEFLGVDKRRLTARCIKHTDDDLERAVLNYRELRAALAGTAHEAMCPEPALSAGIITPERP